MSHKVPPYKLAKVYNGEKEWFVYYQYWSKTDQVYKRQKVRIDQRGLSQEERQPLLEEVCKAINAEIRELNKRKEYRSEGLVFGAQHINRTVIEWLDIAIADTNLKKAWKDSFRQLRTKLEQFYKTRPSFTGSGIRDVDRVFLENYLSYIIANKLATKTINKHLWAIETLSGYLKKLGVIATRIETKDYRVDEIKNETGRFPPLTHEEKERAFAYYQKYNPGYMLMLLCQYYTCIRPAELHRLQVKNFDLVRKTIFVPWLDSKNGLSAYVQILAPLEKALREAGIENLPRDWYLFGNKCVPSKTPYEGQFASNTWTKQREKMGMPKDKQVYGLKHTFNVDYVENNKHNIDWEFLRRHNRHATIQQTQAYISTLTAYFIDETKAVILDYSKK